MSGDGRAQISKSIVTGDTASRRFGNNVRFVLPMSYILLQTIFETRRRYNDWVGDIFQSFTDEKTNMTIIRILYNTFPNFYRYYLFF